MQDLKILNSKAKKTAQSGNIDDAIKLFEEILSVDSAYFEANFNLGVLYTQKKDLEKAVGFYRKCLETKPNDRNSVINLSYLLSSVKHNQAAIREIENYLLEYPRDYEMSNLSESFFSMLISETVEMENNKIVFKEDHSDQLNKNIVLDYPTSSDNSPRWGWGKETHPKLTEIISKDKLKYQILLDQFISCKDDFNKIGIDQDPKNPLEPNLNNPWLTGLDAVSLYSILNLYKPKLYIEVGSGFSTKFAKKSINDFSLNTKIISIDPAPRSEINNLCDHIIRKPLECVNLELFDMLNRNDILFIDNSHRSFMNSDVTVTFLDILPRLKSGVIVQIHDILLPNDYIRRWDNRYYNEQYLLASYLLAEGSKFRILLPNAYLTCNIYSEVEKFIEPFFQNKNKTDVTRMGVSFWIQIN